MQPPYKITASFSKFAKIYVYEESVNAYKKAWSSDTENIEAYGNYLGAERTIIYYQTINGETINCSKLAIQSNTYNNGRGEMIVYGRLWRIPKKAFSGLDNLLSFYIPDSIRCIEEDAFKECNALQKIVIGRGVTEIASNAFDGCTGKLIINCDIPDMRNKESSYTGWFTGTQFNEVVVEEGVTSIGEGAFYDCSLITRLILPATLTEIRRRAFNNCRDLAVVYSKAVTPPQMGYDVFTLNNGSPRPMEDIVIYVPQSSELIYKATREWATYKEQIFGYDFENNPI